MSARRPAALALLLCLATFPVGAQERLPRSPVYARALELQSQGNHSAALSLLWEAASTDTRDADVHNALGEALERIGALDGAITAYRAALAVRPDFRKASNNLILALVKAGKSAEAVERAKALAAGAPSDPDRQFTLALAQSEQDVTAAIEAFRGILSRSPRHVLARFNLALALSRIDRSAEAIEELRRAIEIDARPEMHHALGVIYWHQGDFERAAVELRAATAADDRYADAHATLGAVLKAKGDWKGAAAALRRAIALRPQLAATHQTLAQALQRAGDEPGARAEFAAAETLRQQAAREQEASVLTAAGAEKLERGEFTPAAEAFRRATTILDTYAPAFYQLGRALQALGDRPGAQAAFARARQLNPSLIPPPQSRQ